MAKCCHSPGSGHVTAVGSSRGSWTEDASCPTRLLRVRVLQRLVESQTPPGFTSISRLDASLALMLTLANASFPAVILFCCMLGETHQTRQGQRSSASSEGVDSTSWSRPTMTRDQRLCGCRPIGSFFPISLFDQLLRWAGPSLTVVGVGHLHVLPVVAV